MNPTNFRPNFSLGIQDARREIRATPCGECITKYIAPQLRQIYRKRRGAEDNQGPNDVSLAEFVFKSDASLTSRYGIIFYKRNIIWKAIRSVELTNKRLPEPRSIDDDTISQNQDPTDLSEQDSESTNDDNGMVRCPSCNSLVTDTDDDFNFINIRSDDSDSSSSDSEDDEFIWNNIEDIIYHKTTELDVRENNESRMSFYERRKCKRIRWINKISELSVELQANKVLHKYWLNRYEIFHKYDEGIQLDKESWYSVTPERIAKQIARRCKCNVIIDAFCGAGGNTIQFAFTCNKVIAIDIDPKKIECARNNARIYGVEKKIEFIIGDFLELAPKLQGDMVFLSPPWGGPNYCKERVFDMNMLQPINGKDIYKIARRISTSIAYFLPKNINIRQVRMLAKKEHGIEIEQYLENNNVIAATCYYGDLVTKIN